MRCVVSDNCRQRGQHREVKLAFHDKLIQIRLAVNLGNEFQHGGSYEKQIARGRGFHFHPRGDVLALPARLFGCRLTRYARACRRAMILCVALYLRFGE